jgi:hypothetical protein
MPDLLTSCREEMVDGGGLEITDLSSYEPRSQSFRSSFPLFAPEFGNIPYLCDRILVVFWSTTTSDGAAQLTPGHPHVWPGLSSPQERCVYLSLAARSERETAAVIVGVVDCGRNDDSAMWCLAFQIICTR